MALNKIVHLANDSFENNGFKKKRGFKKTVEKEDDNEAPKTIRLVHQRRLRLSNTSFSTDRSKRNEERSIKFPANIDLIRIHFYAIFQLDLQKKFFNRYGIFGIEYDKFNKSVLFEIINERKFSNLVADIDAFCAAERNSSYEGASFALVALIHDFDFISSDKRLANIPERGAVISLINSSQRVSKQQKDELFSYLEEQKVEIIYNENYPTLLELGEADEATIKELARNFDIIRAVTSARAIKVRPGEYGDLRREFGFTVSEPANLEIVGLIDTGVTRLDPIREQITGINYDHTGYGAYWDESGHGTMVAGLIILGEEFIREVRDNYEAKAKVAVIKAIHNNNDEIKIPALLADIRNARREHGIRIFSMSLNIPSIKKYNENYSYFAYELDRLAYEEDLLIFLSVGNIDADRIAELTIFEPHESHNYPTLFYCPDEGSDIHDCQTTNIHEPADSLNNISVGALAGNLEPGDQTDITPAKEYPAYYTRKFHFDYNQKVNGTTIKKNQTNKHLNKPDIVIEGGDLHEYEAGMEVLRNPLATGQQFYGRACGTSLATPLAASLAAELLALYPTLRTQTIKALLLNNCKKPWGNHPPHFVPFTFDLVRKLTGFGRPSREGLLFSADNAITFVVENDIALEEVIAVPINIPAYFADSGNKLKFDVTLCYSFLPVQHNHLNYLPLHISCGIFQCCDVATIANGDADEYRIKSGISWTEDFFGVENRLFSNAQHMSFNLQAGDMEALENKVCLAIRCTAKSNIDESHRKYLEQSLHEVSVVVSVTEIPDARAGNRLYAAMLENNRIENIPEATAEGESDLTI